jgi:hypothetical protein
MKRRIRLTEGDLRRIVNNSVRMVLRESAYEWAVLDKANGEVVATFKDENVAQEFLQDNLDWCDEVIPMGKNGYSLPYANADDEY